MSKILEYSPSLGRLVEAPGLSGYLGAAAKKRAPAQTPAQRRALLQQAAAKKKQAALAARNAKLAQVKAAKEAAAKKRAAQAEALRKQKADRAAKLVAAKKVQAAKVAAAKAKREQTIKAQREAAVKKAQALKAAQAASKLERANIAKLQNAIRRLSIAVKDNALRIGLDGKNGPKTTAATNLALSKYVTAATPAMRTGRLSVAEVSKGAPAFASLIEAEGKKRVADKIKIAAAAKAAKKKLPAKAVVRSKTIVRKARQGDKAAQAAVAKVTQMANAGNPTAKAAQAVMREEVASGPPESIEEAITEQNEAIEAGEESAFVPSSDAAPESAEYEDMAETTDMISEGEAEEQADAQAADMLEQVDEQTTEATDTAFADEESADFPEGEGETLQDMADELPAAEEGEYSGEEPAMTEEEAATLGADPSIVGLSFKKIGRGIARGAKRTVKTVGKVPIVKQVAAAHVKVAKLSAKGLQALGKGVAKVAATPIKLAIRTPATRRARFIAYKASRGRTKNPTKAQKQQAALWTLAQLNRRGPLGKLGVQILKFAYGKHGGVSGSLGCCAGDMSVLGGMTGAEIAAIASAVVAVISAMTKLLNKPNLAPANLPETVQSVADTAEALDAASEAFEG